MAYLIVVIFLITLSYLYDYKGYSRNKMVWYHVAFWVLVLIAGLRYRIGLDTMRYARSFYYDIPTLGEIKLRELLDSRMEPVYSLFVSIIKTIFGKFYFVQLFHAIIVEGLIFRYIKKHTANIFTAVLLFFIWCFFNFEAEEMRASIAIVLCLYANDYAMEKKYIKCELLVIVAFLFHSSAIVMVFIPFFTLLRFNKLTLYLLAGMFLVGLFIQQNFDNIKEWFGLTERIALRLAHYADESDLSGQRANVLGILNILIVNVLYVSFAILSGRKRRSPKEMKEIESFAVIGMIFAVLSIPVTLFYRYVHFYQIYFIILIADYIIGGVKHGQGAFFNLNKITMPMWIFPFLLLVLWNFMARVPYAQDLRNYNRYFPYSTVIDQTVDRDRERLFYIYNTGEVPYYLY